MSYSSVSSQVFERQTLLTTALKVRKNGQNRLNLAIKWELTGN